MYSKEDASAIRQKFWTNYGKYMQPIPSASGLPVQWVNYKTGIKGIAFKLNADKNCATITIEINLKDEQVQNKYFEIFKTLESTIEKTTNTKWHFVKNYTNEYEKQIGIIYAEINNVNIFKETDWPTIITFLKTNIILLDAFWMEYKVAFELL